MARLRRVFALLTLVIAAGALAASPALARKRDHDKLPDRWERKHHLNLQKNDAKRDRDHDGLSNYREYRARTNPRKKDSDRDGLRDRAEIRFGFHPRDRDSDNDGTKDGRENAGRISKVSDSSITLRLAAGGKLTARLGDALAVACKPASGDDQPAGDAPDDSDPGEDADDPSEDAGDAGVFGVDGNDESDEETDDAPDAPDADASAFGDGDGDPTDDAPAPGEEDDLDDAAFDRQFDAEFAAGGVDCGTTRLTRGALVHEATIDRTGSGPVLVAVKLLGA